MRDGTPNGGSQTCPRVGNRSALSLIEIMVAVALLAVIILGLVAMFDQTRKAFTLGITTSDYQDSGRVVMDMLGRELQQMTPMNSPIMFANSGNPTVIGSNMVNFYVDAGPIGSANLAWPLVQAGDAMITTQERLFFVTRYNRQWTAIGYKLDPNSIGLGVGTLYRYSANSITNRTANPLLDDFFNNPVFNPPANIYLTNSTPFNRIIDGVVNFRVRAYTGQGINAQFAGPGVMITGSLFYKGNTNLFATNYPPASPVAGEYHYEFYGNAVPGYVDVELGVLEPRTLERYRALTNNPSAALAYLTNHAGQVHTFRQRIPVRNIDPSVYP